MTRLVATWLAGVIVLAVLATTGIHGYARAVVPDDAGISASAACEEDAGSLTLGTEPVAYADVSVGGMVLACEFQKPTRGCKKSPCDGVTYCCSNGRCTP
jgi:hypothetical protein